MATRSIYRVMTPEVHFEARFVEAASRAEAIKLAFGGAGFASTYREGGFHETLSLAEAKRVGIAADDIHVDLVMNDEGEPASEQEIERALDPIRKKTVGPDDFEAAAYHALDFQDVAPSRSRGGVQLDEAAKGKGNGKCNEEATTMATQRTIERSGEGRDKGLVRGALDATKADLLDAGVRATADVFAETVREPVVAMLLREAGLEGKFAAKAVGTFLNTRLGEGVFSYALGVALPLVARTFPQEAFRAHAERFGDELRVAGQAALLKPLVRALRDPVRDLIAAKIGDAMGAVGRVRVEADGAAVADGDEADDKVDTLAAKPARTRR